MIIDSQADVPVTQPPNHAALMGNIQIIGNDVGPIFKAIAEVMTKIKSVDKDAKHAQGYGYVSWAEISHTVQREMGEAGLTVMPTISKAEIIEDSTKDSSKIVRKWHVNYNMVIGCGASNSILIVPWFSESMISFAGDDKGTAKASTYSMKNFLSKLFMITTKDDDDADANDIEDAEVRDRGRFEKPMREISRRNNNSPAKTGTSSTHQPNDSSASSEPSSQAPSAPTTTTEVSPTAEVPANAEAKPATNGTSNRAKEQQAKPPRTSKPDEKASPAPVPVSNVELVDGIPVKANAIWLYNQLVDSGAKVIKDNKGEINHKETVKQVLLKVGYDTNDTPNTVDHYKGYIKAVEQMHILEVACEASGKTLEQALNACELIYHFDKYDVIEPAVMNWLTTGESGAIIESPEEPPPIPVEAESGNFDFDFESAPITDPYAGLPDTDPSEIA